MDHSGLLLLCVRLFCLLADLPVVVFEMFEYSGSGRWGGLCMSCFSIEVFVCCSAVCISTVAGKKGGAEVGRVALFESGGCRVM